MSVPFLDLRRQHEAVGDAVEARVAEVVDRQAFVLGEAVEAFERALADHEGMGRAVGVNSGTDALELALRALGVGEGDEVVTSPFTFFATAGAIHHAGARPVFADVEPGTFNLDPAAAEAAVGPDTVALLPVHLFGQMADVEALGEVADRHGLAVLEDAAQAVGARRDTAAGRMAPGEAADAAALSFYPAKNLGAWGDAGAVLTGDPGLADRVRELRVHGAPRSYHHETVGRNARLDALQAAVLDAKLEHLEGWNRARAANAAFYQERFADLEAAGRVRRPAVDEAADHVWHQYTLRATDRDALREHLEERGIGHGVYYPVPLHLQPCFEDLGHAEGDFPEAERAAREVISLPVFPELTEAERAEVADAVEGFYR